MFNSIAALLGICLLAGGCQGVSSTVPDWPWTDPDPVNPPVAEDPNKDVVEAGWTNVGDTYGKLAEGINVYSSPETMEGRKAKAFIAVSSGSFDVWSIRDPQLQGSDDDLKTPKDVYDECGAPIVINGGYFYTDGGKNYAASLAVSDGELLAPNINYASEDWVKIYYPTRGVFVQHNDGRTEAAWTYFSSKDKHYLYQEPAANSWSADPLGVPGSKDATAFEAKTAIGAGPVLIKNGKIRNTGDEELFQKTEDVGYAKTNPRTAIGRTADGRIVLFVCEGREMTEGVAGYTTEEVAKILLDLGCVEALNLDGGGSTCMLVNGKETVKPSDGRERRVGSCVVLGAKAPKYDKPVTPVEPAGAKPRYLWIDASANFQYFANDKEYITKEVNKIKETGFTDIIVDIRPTEGTVLYKSKVAPEARRLAAWVGGQYKFINRTADFDYLQAFIDAGHAAGLKVNAAINTFVGGYGGYYGLESEGPIFSGDIPEGWATVINAENGLTSSYYKGVAGTVFLNPANPDVQDYVLNILAEIAAYDVDGIILDRCRYDDNGVQCEFSDISKAGFEQYLGATVKNWPGDVFAAGATDIPSKPADMQKKFLAYRAKTIHDFIVKAAEKVHSVNAKTRFGVYVGAWYSSYYSSGVNWGSPRYDTSKHYNWASADYKDYGFADHCDFMMLGCYASTSSVYGNTEWTMQGFAKLAKDILKGDTVFAGGPDIGNPTGFPEGGQGAVVTKSVDACINQADGYFCFDLCHIRMYDYWDALRKGFDNYLNSLK